MEYWGQEPLWGLTQGAVKEEVEWLWITLISSLIADLVAVPQRTILKALNSKYSYLTHIK